MEDTEEVTEEVTEGVNVEDMEEGTAEILVQEATEHMEAPLLEEATENLLVSNEEISVGMEEVETTEVVADQWLPFVVLEEGQCHPIVEDLWHPIVEAQWHLNVAAQWHLNVAPHQRQRWRVDLQTNQRQIQRPVKKEKPVKPVHPVIMSVANQHQRNTNGLDTNALLTSLQRRN